MHERYGTSTSSSSNSSDSSSRVFTPRSAVLARWLDDEDLKPRWPHLDFGDQRDYSGHNVDKASSAKPFLQAGVARLQRP